MNNRFKSKTDTKCGQGWLDKKNGLVVLHLKGSYYDMGYQHGTLLRDWCIKNLKATLDLAKKQNVDLTNLKKNWMIIKNYIPKNNLEEMKGLGDAIEMSLDRIGMIWIIGEYLYFRCCGVSIWENATKNHKLIHMRSYDVPFTVKDPSTMEFIQDHSILIIAEPDDGYVFMYPTMAGFVCHGGINEKGMALSYTWSWNNDGSMNGIPVVIRLNKALAYSSSVEEVIEILSENRTCGYNYIISDGKKREGCVLEQTINHSIVNKWDSHEESNYPFWSIENCVRRTNFFINTQTAKTQRIRYKTNGIINFMNMVTGVDYLGDALPVFISWRHYRTLSKQIEKKYGSIDLDCAISLLRNTYCGNTDPFLAIIQKLAKKRYTPMHQWVACPETGDMLLSFSDSKNSVEKNKIYYCNLFNLLTNS